MHVRTRPGGGPEHKENGSARPSRRGRYLRRTALGLAAFLALTYVAAGWYVSGEIIDGIHIYRSEVEYDTDVIAVEDNQIILDVSDERDVGFDGDAVMGLRWEGGYGQVGPAISVEGSRQVRPFSLLDGSPPPVGGDIADFDSFAFTGDPAALNLDFETVTYPAPLGDLQAWHIPGESSTWIIAVHGRRADRDEFLRLIDSVRDAGHPLLVIRYRNDEDSPQTEDSMILAGQKEWEDVAAAVDYAVSRGATGVVVSGMSLGGGITLSYAMHAEPGLVKGLILEAPVADLREIVRLRSGEALPVGGPIGDSILAVGRLVTWLRTGLDFDEVDYIERADELAMPILWFHGTDDTTVPHEVGEQFRDARPDLIEFHSITDAVHVRAWNEDPERYGEVVTAFLARVSAED